MAEKVKHIGKIARITADTIEVNIVSMSACASCANKASCGTSEMKDKLIIVPKTGLEQQSFNVGDEVYVLIEQKKAFAAMLLSYFLPAILLITTLFVSIKYLSETAAALMSLGVIALYFLAFLLIKPLLNKKFQMSILPKDEAELNIQCFDNMDTNLNNE